MLAAALRPQVVVVVAHPRGLDPVRRVEIARDDRARVPSRPNALSEKDLDLDQNTVHVLQRVNHALSIIEAGAEVILEDALVVTDQNRPVEDVAVEVRRRIITATKDQQQQRVADDRDQGHGQGRARDKDIVVLLLLLGRQKINQILTGNRILE